MSEHRLELASPVANPIRTAGQLVPAVAITEFLSAFFLTLDERQYAALVGALLLLTSVIQNAIEYKKGRALLKPHVNA